MNEDLDNHCAVEEAPRGNRASRRELGGAAVVGGILGLAIAGPMVGVVAGAGAAAVTTTKGKAGQIARASGEAVSSSGDRLKQWNRKYRVTSKASNAIRSAGSNLKRWDEKHSVTQKTSNAIITGCNKFSKSLKKDSDQQIK